MTLSSVYQHVDPDFYDQIELLAQNEKEIKIFFFKDNVEVDSALGKVDTVIQENKAEFLQLKTGDRIRLDRIITLNGVPGPQYNYYASFGSSCSG
jgi:transcriptional antiterminator Rof (Rho-off)